MKLATRVTEAWQRRASWLYLLLPLMALYRAVIVIRRYAYRKGWRAIYRAPVPVIVVGNITVGGTGKSPMVSALAIRCLARGLRPGILSRGYGADRQHDTPFLVTSTVSAREVGDEPAMLAQQLSCPIVVCRDRRLGIERLVQEGCDVVIADDGMQHYRMARDIEICMVDGARWWGNGHLLPVGPLREPLSRLQEVDCLVINSGGCASEPQARYPAGKPLFHMQLRPGALRPLHHQGFAEDGAATAVDAHDAPDAEQLSKATSPKPPAAVHAVAGIGNPERFFTTLRELGYQVHTHPLPDHHRYTPEDIQFADKLPVVLTAKDAVKCQHLEVGDVWQLPVEAQLDAAFDDFIFNHAALRGKIVEQPTRSAGSV